MPTDWPTRAAQIRAGATVRTCEVSGCRLPTYRLGRICEGHRTALRTKGSTTATRVTIKELRPWRTMALAFVVDQEAKGHPAVLAALDYLQRAARTAAALERETRQGQRPRPAARVDAFLGLMHRDAIDLRLILAWGTACELHRLQEPRRWPDALHSGHQFAAAVATLARRRARQGASAGVSRPCTPKPSTGYLRELARQLRDPLVAFYAKAAQHLHNGIERTAHPVPRAALETPFTTFPT